MGVGNQQWENQQQTSCNNYWDLTSVAAIAAGVLRIVAHDLGLVSLLICSIILLTFQLTRCLGFQDHPGQNSISSLNSLANTRPIINTPVTHPSCNPARFLPRSIRYSIGMLVLVYRGIGTFTFGIFNEICRRGNIENTRAESIWDNNIHGIPFA